MIRIEITIEKQDDGQLHIRFTKLYGSERELQDIELKIAEAIEARIGDIIVKAAKKTKRLKLADEGGEG